MRRLIAMGICLFTLTACGLSQQEVSKYDKELKYAAEVRQNSFSAAQKFMSLEEKAQSIGYYGSSALASARKYQSEMTAYGRYEECLKGYLASKEKFVIAKTNCTLESGIPK
jgi:hypothetical protein